MKRALIYAAAQLLAALIVFGLFAFVQWDASPGNWSQDARFFAAMLWACAALAAGIGGAAINGDLEP